MLPRSFLFYQSIGFWQNRQAFWRLRNKSIIPHNVNQVQSSALKSQKTTYFMLFSHSTLFFSFILSSLTGTPDRAFLFWRRNWGNGNTGLVAKWSLRPRDVTSSIWVSFSPRRLRWRCRDSHQAFLRSFFENTFFPSKGTGYLEQFEVLTWIWVKTFIKKDVFLIKSRIMYYVFFPIASYKMAYYIYTLSLSTALKVSWITQK